MGLRYNPFTGSFDFTRSPGSYLDGEVATYDDLPLDTAAAPLNSAWLVREASGLWLLTRKPAGIYVRSAAGGTDRDADYTYAGTFPDVFSDANFVVYNDADSTKNVKFSAANLTTGTTRTLTVPDASGTLPLLESANTFTQNQTLNGTNNVAPNQTAASGSSIMTRALVDSKLLLREFPLHPKSVSFFTYHLNTTAVATGGNAGAASSGYRAISSTTSGSRAAIRLSNATSQLQSVFSKTNWSQPVVFGAKIFNVEIAFEANAVQRIIWGAANGYTDGDPTTRCVGFRFENGTVFGFCHDGTTYTEPVSESTILPALRAIDIRSHYSVFVTSDGAGNIEWFVDGTSIGTSSAGPSTLSVNNQADIIIQAQSNDTLANSNVMSASFFYIAAP
jgi:hypothetical protein